MEFPSFENDSIPVGTTTKDNIKLLAQKQRYVSTLTSKK
jgi:hypothetical protein